MAQKLLGNTRTVLVKRDTSARNKKILEVAGALITLVASLVAKKPGLMPVLQVLQGLVPPSNDPALQPTRLVINRIKRLKKRLAKANEQDQAKIRQRLEALYELLIEDGEDDE